MGTTRALSAVVSGVLVMGASLALAPPADAAAPPNANHGNAIRITPPQTVNGTLVDATLDTTGTGGSVCGNGVNASAWYRFTGPSRGAVVLQLNAGGEMDATVTLLHKVRSKISQVACDSTDPQGKATLDSSVTSGGDYLIAIDNQIGSVADTFQLKVLVPGPLPKPPGRHLPDQGISNRVNRVPNPWDAYWTRMQAGRTMRLNLSSRKCAPLWLFGPGTTSFRGTNPVKYLGCGGYGVFTPTESGRYFLVVGATLARGWQAYHLRVAPAGRDDIAPGILLHNHATVRGSVNGGIDTRDLYRFDVAHRSALTLSLSGSPKLRLLRDDGRRVGGGLADQTIRAGRYVAVVEGSGHYSLHLSLRTITHASLFVDDRHDATIGPRATARLHLVVRPVAAGPSAITVERFDPIEGWQFLRTFRPRVSAGSAHVAFKPPSVGRYRAFATYRGSRDAAPSRTTTVHLKVQTPLGH